MKTLLISGIYRPEIGGPATYIPALASEIQTQSGSVEVVTLKNSTATELNEPWSIKYVTRDQFLPLRFIKTYFCIKSRVKTNDFVLANGLFQETSIALLGSGKKSLAKIVGDPVWERAFNRGETSLNIEEFNKSKLNIKHKTQRLFLKWSLNRFSQITCPSLELKNFIKDWGVNKTVSCIPNGIPTIEPRVNSNEFDLISVCRLVKWKNLDHLITANAVNKTKLVIVGSGPEEERLKKLANKLNSNVTFTGQLSEQEVIHYLFRSKIFVLISEYEGLSFSLLQAMACALPSIVSNVKGNLDVITDNIDGIVIDRNMPNSLLDAINLLLQKPADMRRLGEKAREKVLNKYSQKNQLNQVIKLLRDS
jgi:glycosyltransferase involved in cell wall biosynthesis